MKDCRNVIEFQHRGSQLSTLFSFYLCYENIKHEGYCQAQIYFYYCFDLMLLVRWIWLIKTYPDSFNIKQNSTHFVERLKGIFVMDYKHNKVKSKNIQSQNYYLKCGKYLNVLLMYTTSSSPSWLSPFWPQVINSTHKLFSHNLYD